MAMTYELSDAEVNDVAGGTWPPVDETVEVLTQVGNPYER